MEFQSPSCPFEKAHVDYNKITYVRTWLLALYILLCGSCEFSKKSLLLAGRFAQKFISVESLLTVDLVIVLVLTTSKLRSRRKIQICHQGLLLESKFKLAICCLARCFKFG